jgi:hypothetical protein
MTRILSVGLTAFLLLCVANPTWASCVVTGWTNDSRDDQPIWKCPIAEGSSRSATQRRTQFTISLRAAIAISLLAFFLS